MGIGVDLGFQFFGPAQINDYLDTVYSRMKAVYRSNGYMITGERGTPTMFLGFDVGGHIMVRPIPWIAVGGIGRYFSSTKKLKISTSSASLLDAMSDPDVTVSARDGVVGGKIEAFVNPKKTVTLKGGINIEAHFASVELKNENTVTLSGKGIGYTPFLGLSIAPGGGHALISLDFMAPICKIKLNTVKGAFDPTEDRYAFPSSSSTAKPIQYPRELNLTGFMFKPSVTICFP